ncbi:MAG: ATP-binding protein, partial [Lachnospiraceae bacterium]|nr:ATP-binding protein [Lachnospiraceae bacterium]
MGMLEMIQSGRENRPPRIMIYGSEGVGKSTFAASAPNPVFIQTEDGLGELDCRKFPLAHSLAEVLAQLTALRDEQHDVQTVVVDSADWLERLIFDEVCREFGVRSI